MPEIAKITDHGHSFTVTLADTASQKEAAMALVPKTPNQELYLIQLQFLMPYVIVTGPAGTGKTAMPCQEAVYGLHQLPWAPGRNGNA